MRRVHRLRAFTLVEVMFTVTIVGILTVVTIPTFEAEIGGTQRDACEAFLIHMNQDAQTLAAVNGESAPTFNDYVNAASEVYYANAANQTLALSTTAGNSLSLGSVSVTVENPGPTETVGLAMVSSQPGISVYLESSGVAGSAPVVWACSSNQASSSSAATNPKGC